MTIKPDALPRLAGYGGDPAAMIGGLEPINPERMSLSVTRPLFSVPTAPLIPIHGMAEGFPIHRIFCVGRNYAAHAAELGNTVDRVAPFYFTKPATGLVLEGGAIAYPPGTEDYHHEIELVIAIGSPAFRVSTDDAMKAVFGYAVGLDMTRRDLQNAMKEKQRPWDIAKAFEESAVIGAITRASEFAPDAQRISLVVNDSLRQEGHLNEMVWSVPEMISHLSRYYHLTPGDLIFTGTPSGVGALQPGDRLTGAVDGLSPISVTIGPAA
ncbi:fumarylacetoacetate hydrolase [Agrobacterium albertimagni AOL15]|uniref:Fumarylacetoacetate hydrolase n=1 Tax=Agrobacterium albertimagni AOL15 TaxID=1156935 RepID=K2Q539_9HYPH|nr:fumarylacetoacetate hydrolase [Agrobacterium albertimagni AOL15]